MNIEALEPSQRNGFTEADMIRLSDDGPQHFTLDELASIGIPTTATAGRVVGDFTGTRAAVGRISINQKGKS